MLNQSIYFTTPGKGPLSPERHGTVLLIVLVILTIFAGVGIAFMFYAESEASSALAFRDQFEFRGPDMDPEMAFAMFLQQLIFDCRDDASGISSALRGHSFYRNMYGMKYLTGGPATGTVLATPLNAFGGTTRQHWTWGAPGMPNNPILNTADDFNLINYAYFPTDGFVRYPEFFGTTAGPKPKGGLAANELPYVGAANPPYSAADMNFMALAAVTADGTVLLPSFHRDWTGFGSLDPSNPNWKKVADPSLEARLKYMVMRPRPSDHPDLPSKGKKGFPMPMDAFGDVRNRPIAWQGTGNDSFWMYTGAPILTLPDGRRYTALFAPFVIDLDSKINLNATGNIRGAGFANASNQGWGPWEMNLGKVLSDPTIDPVTGAPEWVNLFVGATAAGQPTPRVLGRYGPLKAPTGNATPPFTTAPRFYGKADFDAVVNPGGAITGQWTPPGPYQMWPTFPPAYGDGIGSELGQHPLVYNPVTGVAGSSRVFLPAELNMIYRYGDTNTDSMLCDLWQLLPNNFKDRKKRNLITTLSFDRREPGLMPWLYNFPSATAAAPYAYEMPPFTSGANSPALKPSGKPIGSPKPGSTNLGKDYDPLWANRFVISPPNLIRSGARIDLNKPLLDPKTGAPRALSDYPILVGNAITDVTGFRNAQKDRQDFASILFQILVKTTGAYDLTNHSVSTPPTSGELYALRYLAQLAVNMVDFIDSDDYITPFNWVLTGNGTFQTTYGSLAGNIVYGTEMPKIVINEAFCRYRNDNTEPSMSGAPPTQFASNYIVDVWAELFNPIKADAALNEGGNARLYLPAAGNSAYRLLVTLPNQDMHKPDNSQGSPDGAIKGTVKDSDFNLAQVIKPLPISAFAASPDNQGSNVGFYLVGPKDPSSGLDVAFPVCTTPAPAQPPKATINAAGMSYRYALPNPGGAADDGPPPNPSLVLQRLCCPYSPLDTNPASPSYNPYVTVDYFQNIVANDGTTHNNIVGNSGVVPGTLDSRIPNHKSVGRQQPFLGSAGVQPQLVPQTGQPQHTFFYHNYRVGPTIPGSVPWPPAPSGIAYPPFDWLVHLDRNLVNPMELLHVSGYGPHELTQQFNGKMFGQQAPWFDNATRLYRFFEFVETAPRMTGTNGRRVPGKININTIWDIDVFMAMCDPQGSSRFTLTDIGRIWDRLTILRNPGGPPTYPGGPTYQLGTQPSPYDQPFFPLSVGVIPKVGDLQFPPATYPNGVGIGNTLLRPFGPLPNDDPTQAVQKRLFEPPDTLDTTNPYIRYELLTKIYNNMTTRSNCFAVWVTVGFFEVQDPDPNDPLYKKGPIMGSYLGQEIGRSEGRNVRHKMFAIVDRSVLDPAVAYSVPPGSAPKDLAGFVGGILNQTIPFNPHATGYKELI
ncbi:MAG TPA: hypothetical protein VE988_17705, partial [Gemmataceae bacterium]|nr:hypothetical protein [Gemmataceae bacterium]